ncbi:LysR family carnitine catabolism transcriptional activator [Streptomyces sp. SAI-144]|nr:LysR family carnitine catabolism transcriptional activator [Streptomyces sp. SAI-144]
MEATTLRQLTAYTAVARAASFTAAAAEMHVSQSSLSRAVADLERQLGVQLLERDTRNVQLTAAGVEALRIAEQIVTAHRAGMKELRRFLLGESGTVAVATLPSVAAVLLPQVISDFRERRPQVAVRLLDGLERLVLDRVLSGDADFAITTVGDPPEQLEHRPLVRDRFVAVLPEGHPLAERHEVAWDDLARQPFLAVGRDSSVRRLTDAAFAQIDAHAGTGGRGGQYRDRGRTGDRRPRSVGDARPRAPADGLRTHRLPSSGGPRRGPAAGHRAARPSNAPGRDAAVPGDA